jgi:hypothetical protein
VGRPAEASTVVLVACLLGALAVTTHGDASAPRRGDAKAYRVLDDTKRLPTLDRGEVERTLASYPWRPTPRQADDPVLAEPEGRRQILDATCDADLVVIARVESAVPFQHPNDRWVLTAHDLAVSRVVRVRTPKLKQPQRLRYVHPSGELSIAGRAVRTMVGRFPPFASDEEALFFLVRIGRSDGYRTSLALPPMALRGGILDPLGVVILDAAREPAAGLRARDAVRLVADAVCRPAPIERDWRPPSTRSGRLPPLGQPSPPPFYPP